MNPQTPSEFDPAKVWLQRLKLDLFRNYRSVDLTLDEAHVVLTGENGAGKTNLLEAVSLLTPGRGLRRSSYADMSISDGNGTWAISAVIHGPAGETRLGTGLQALVPGAPPQRRTRVNGEATRRSEELLDLIRVLWLTPAMDGLFAGPASDRRRFVDRMVLAIDPEHGRRVSDFERAMRGRNRLLEEGSADPAWLDGVEAQMAGLGTAIAAARQELMGLLTGLIESRRRADSAFPQAEVAMEGFPEDEVGVSAAVDLEDVYLGRLRDGRRRDAAAGRTLAGPHRSEFHVIHSDKQTPAARCSTGEQKALLIGLTLSHARLVAEVAGQIPVLLLDEVAAHLDARRRAALFAELNDLGCQAWMTGTDPDPFEPLGAAAQRVHVVSGVAEPMGSMG